MTHFVSESIYFLSLSNKGGKLVARADYRLKSSLTCIELHELC